MVVSEKIRLLLTDMGFLPTGSDISETCWRHSICMNPMHITSHRPVGYHVNPHHRLQAVIVSYYCLSYSMQRAAVIIYVHMVVVSWPRGHLVHLGQFQLYDARRAENPTNAK